MTRGKATRKGGRQDDQALWVGVRTEFEELMRRVCEHTGWRYHVEHQGDGTVVKITAWLGPSERPQAMLDMHVDLKHGFRDVVVPEGYRGLPEVRLFQNAMVGEIKSLVSPKVAQEIDERWRQALNPSGGARDKVKKRRERGANEGSIEDCKKALEYWLDDGLPLQTATEQAGIGDKRTVKNRIADVLEDVPVAKREEWIRKLRAKRLTEYLGRFREL